MVSLSAYPPFGHQFDPNTTETTRITSEAVYDEAQRTITHMRYLIELRTVIYGQQGDPTGPEGQLRTDDQMNLIRRRLQSPGGALHYSDRGFGTFEINTGGAQKDVMWGPKPRVLSWEPWGDANAAMVTWQVEVCIPECSAAKYENHAMAYNWQVIYDIDADGLTTRRVSGYLQIPQTRSAQQNRHFNRSADEYREDIQPRALFGFRPVVKTFNLSPDKCRLDFTFVDEEMGPNIPPPGIIRAEASMEAATDSSLAAIRYTYVLRASYDLVRGASSDLARLAFKKLYDSKKDLLLNRPQIRDPALFVPGVGAAIAAANSALLVIPMAYRVREPQIYGKFKTCEFQVVLNVVFASPQPFMAHGFWTPIPDSDWNKWRANAGEVLFGVRGNAGLKFDPIKDTDLIVDLCGPDIRKPTAVDSTLRKASAPTPNSGAAYRNGTDGWAHFQQRFSLVQADSTMVHKPLGNSVSPNDLGPKTIAGSRCKPTYYVIHEGEAVKVGSPIADPKVEAVGTFKLIPCNRSCDRFVQDISMGQEHRVYRAKWRRRYICVEEIGENGPVFNPTFDEGNTFLTFENGKKKIAAGENEDDGGGSTSTLTSGGIRRF